MLLVIIRKLYRILNPRERRQAIVILIIGLISALLDAAGVASIFPFMAVAANPDSVQTQPVLAWLYQGFNFAEPQDFLLVICGLSLVVLLASIGFRAFTTWASLRFVFMREYSLSERLLKLYLAQPYEWFLNHHSAELSKMVLAEVTQVTQGVITPMLDLGINIALTIALIALLLAMEPWLTIGLIGFLGLAYIISFKLSNRGLVKVAEQRFQANQMRFHLASEAFSAVKDLKATGQEQIFTRRYDTYARQYAEKYIQAQVVAQAPRFFLEALVMGGSLVVLLYFLASSRQIEEVIPTLSLFAFAGYRLIPSLQAIFRNLVSLRFISTSLHALHNDFVSLDRPHPAQPANGWELPFNHALSLRDISFTYLNARRPTLQEICLTIRSGTTTALVGSTGSGKTTLVDLVLGLLWPDGGQILIDGVQLSTTTLSAWQAQVGYVSQHVLLLDDTIAANIAFGPTDQPIDYAAVEQVARQALIHDFIVTELPQGYETKVGERGVRLSGGQRQRLGIARALYRKPRLLIFDESTSALDTVTEREIMRSLEYLRGQVTIIMIAHRMSTVQHCDQIILLENGKVSAQGKFAELLETCRSFRDLNQSAIANA